MKIRAATAVAALCAASVAQAWPTSGPASRLLTSGMKVDQQQIVYASTGWSSEGFYVSTQGTLPAGANCGNGNTFIILPSHPYMKEMVSMLFMSLQNKRNVDLYVEGCHGNAINLKAVKVNAQ